MSGKKMRAITEVMSCHFSYLLRHESEIDYQIQKV